MKQIQFNKQLILDFYSQVIGQRDINYAHTIIAEDYIQHNPFIQSGRAGVIAVLEQLKQVPQDPNAAANNTLWVMNEGNLLGTYLKVDFMGKKQIVMDLFRVDQGLIVEHWDAIQETDTPRFMEIPAIPEMINEVKTTNIYQNKHRVQTYLREVWQKQQYQLLDEFVSPNVAFYHPAMGKKEDKLQAYQQSITLQKAHRVIAEGDFVMVQCSAAIQGEASVLYLIYRLEQGKIAEGWSASQSVPAQALHHNGMI